MNKFADELKVLREAAKDSQPLITLPVVELRLFLADRAERIEAVVRAAHALSDSLNGGFVRCARCGDQEDTTDLDFAPELRQALAALEEE